MYNCTTNYTPATDVELDLVLTTSLLTFTQRSVLCENANMSISMDNICTMRKEVVYINVTKILNRKCYSNSINLATVNCSGKLRKKNN